MEAGRKKNRLRKGTAFLCAAAVLLSGCFGQCGLFSMQPGKHMIIMFMSPLREMI